MVKDGGDARGAPTQLLQPGATARRAGDEHRGVTRGFQSKGIGAVSASHAGSSSAGAVNSVAYHAQESGPAVEYVPAVQAVAVQSIKAASSTVTVPARQQVGGITSNEEAMLAKINRLRAHTQHELNRAQVLAQRQKLANEGGGGGFVPAGPLEVVVFATTSIMATLLVFIRIGLPAVFL